MKPVIQTYSGGIIDFVDRDNNYTTTLHRCPK